MLAACRNPLSAGAADRGIRDVHGQGIRPGEAAQTDEQWATYLRQSAFLGYHGVSTCRMGADADAVVDSELRLRGLEGLRIVDASVLPSLISGNTHATVVMLAERAADLILGTKPLT